MKIFLALLLLLCATPTRATSYFLNTAAGGGNDSNSGLNTGVPWLSPNHALNCGDTITAAASTSYSAANFGSGKWGTVSSCGTGSSANVAWLICITFDACKITSSTNSGMQVSASNWGIQGWEVTTTTGASLACFFPTPPNSSTSIHHIIFANDIANGCQNGGFSAIYNGSAATDYIAYVGDIAYNAAQQGPGCASAFNIVNPVAFDSLSGTHMYISGVFGFATVDGASCASPAPTDGEGMILDSLFTNAYTQQIAIENSIFVGNGGRCIEVFKNNSGAGSLVYIQNITCWNNQTQSTQQPGGNLGEIFLYQSKNVTVTKNISKTNQANGPQGFAYYAADVNTGDATDSVATNDLYSGAAHYCLAQFGTGSPCGTNLNTDPAFSSPSVPGAPSCGAFSSVMTCMATVISNFAATGGGLSGYGFQTPPTTGSSGDPLFPAWLCNVNLPSGLVYLNCGAAGGMTGTTISKGVTVPSNVIVK